MLKTLVIIPTYNEADNIAELTKAIFKLNLGVDILVVDDNSPDGTSDLVLTLQTKYPNLFLLKRDKKDGLGRAYLAGFAWAREHNYEAVVQMDADFSHSPKHLPAMLGALESKDFVIGSRYVKGGGVVNWSLTRRIISRGGGLYARTILGLNIKDLTGGFNAWKITTLDKINLATVGSNGYSFQIELKTKASRAGCAHVEVPITFEERRLGQSKLKGPIITEAIWRVWQIRWQMLNKQLFLAGLALLILTVLIYQPIFKSTWLTVWDDNLQVTQNPNITALTLGNLKNIFSGFYVGMYQPLTTLSYALDYHFFGLSSPIFHGLNLLLHLINILLVYCLAKNILKTSWHTLTCPEAHRRSVAEGLPLAVTAIFALHPMQVEAVAWVSARSTLLCSTFILWGTLTYWRYVIKEKNSDLWKTLALFILALLSKPLAIIFPLIMLLIDWYHHKLNKKTLITKIPFFLIALLFGLIMLKARQEAGHLGNFGGYYAWWENIFIVLTALSFYLSKLFWPLNLSAFYAYPLKNSGWLPLTFYLSPVILIILSFALIYLKKINRLPRLITLGLGWFMINLILVLKIIPLGAQTTTDRYNYLAMLGLLLIIVFLLANFMAKYPTTKKIILPIGFLVLMALSYLTWSRVKVWQNDLSLLDDAVAKTYPDTNLYSARGKAKWQADDYSGALEDFNHSLIINPGNLDAHYYRGMLLAKNFQRYEEAILELNFVIKNEPDNSLFYDRGNLKSNMNDLPGAIEDYTKAIALNNNWLYYFSRANTYGQLKQYPEALKDYDQTINLIPAFPSAYYYKGLTLLNLKRINEACATWHAGADVGMTIPPTWQKLCSL